MTAYPRPYPTVEQIPCEVCHKEVPLSEANQFEAQDYVAHFCGLECYSEWKRRSEGLTQPPQVLKR